MNDKTKRDISPQISRRRLLAVTGAMATMPALSASQTFAETSTAPDRSLNALKDRVGTKLVLLGTKGGPSPGTKRRQSSYALIADDGISLVDCGLGATERFAEAGLLFKNVRDIFITHHHFDHVVDLGPFLAVGWTRGLPTSVKVYGPPPIAQMTRDLMAAYRPMIDLWGKEREMNPLHDVATTEISGPGPVADDGAATVSCALGQHPPVSPAFGYRFDFPDRSIAFSGDTRAVPEIENLAKGVDILVHEAMYVPAVENTVRKGLASGRTVTPFEIQMEHLLSSHADVVEVGRLAQRAGVKTLVLSHMTPLGVDDADWLAAAQQEFGGEVIVGSDLMVL